METVYIEICGDYRQKKCSQNPGHVFQPAKIANFQKLMHKSDVDRDTEYEEKVDGSVHVEGDALVGQHVNKGHVGIENGAEKTNRGKQDIDPLAAAPKNGKGGKPEEDRKTEKRRKNVQKRGKGCMWHGVSSAGKNYPAIFVEK
jgi:hypothetical protein